MRARCTRRGVRRSEGARLRVPLSLTVALALGSGGLQATTITVTSAGDSGTGTLCQAVSDAANGDTITF